MSLKKLYKSFILISLFSFLLLRLFEIFQNCLGDLDFKFLNLFCVSFFVFTNEIIKCFSLYILLADTTEA